MTRFNHLNDVRTTRRKADAFATVPPQMAGAIASAKLDDEFRNGRTNSEQLENVVNSHRRKLSDGFESEMLGGDALPDGYIESVNEYGGLK